LIDLLTFFLLFLFIDLMGLAEQRNNFINKVLSQLTDKEASSQFMDRLNMCGTKSDQPLEPQLLTLYDLRKSLIDPLLHVELYFLFPVKFIPLTTRQQDIILASGKSIISSFCDHAKCFEELNQVLSSISLPSSDVPSVIPNPSVISKPSKLGPSFDVRPSTSSLLKPVTVHESLVSTETEPIPVAPPASTQLDKKLHSDFMTRCLKEMPSSKYQEFVQLVKDTIQLLEVRNDHSVVERKTAFAQNISKFRSVFPEHQQSLLKVLQTLPNFNQFLPSSSAIDSSSSLISSSTVLAAPVTTVPAVTKEKSVFPTAVFLEPTKTTVTPSPSRNAATFSPSEMIPVIEKVCHVYGYNTKSLEYISLKHFFTFLEEKISELAVSKAAQDCGLDNEKFQVLVFSTVCLFQKGYIEIVKLTRMAILSDFSQLGNYFRAYHSAIVNVLQSPSELLPNIAQKYSVHLSFLRPLVEKVKLFIERLSPKQQSLLRKKEMNDVVNRPLSVSVSGGSADKAAVPAMQVSVNSSNEAASELPFSVIPAATSLQKQSSIVDGNTSQAVKVPVLPSSLEITPSKSGMKNSISSKLPVSNATEFSNYVRTTSLTLVSPPQNQHYKSGDLNLEKVDRNGSSEQKVSDSASTHSIGLGKDSSAIASVKGKENKSVKISSLKTTTTSAVTATSNLSSKEESIKCPNEVVDIIINEKEKTVNVSATVSQHSGPSSGVPKRSENLVQPSVISAVLSEKIAPNDPLLAAPVASIVLQSQKMSQQPVVDNNNGDVNTNVVKVTERKMESVNESSIFNDSPEEFVIVSFRTENNDVTKDRKFRISKQKKVHRLLKNYCETARQDGRSLLFTVKKCNKLITNFMESVGSLNLKDHDIILVSEASFPSLAEQKKPSASLPTMG
jgi:hypothetical protein